MSSIHSVIKCFGDFIVEQSTKKLIMLQEEKYNMIQSSSSPSSSLGEHVGQI